MNGKSFRLTATLREFRKSCWIVMGRQQVKVLSKCITCKLLQLHPFDELPAIFLLDRIRRTQAFAAAGIDIAGPLFMILKTALVETVINSRSLTYQRMIRLTVIRSHQWNIIWAVDRPLTPLNHPRSTRHYYVVAQFCPKGTTIVGNG